MSNTSGPTLEIRTSPHLNSGRGVDDIMRNVVLALLPTTGFAVAAFGLAAIAVLVTAVVSCLLAESLLGRWAGSNGGTLSDWSVAVTGLLYGLTLPPTLPLWMVVVGGFVAVGLGKVLFGGLGQNVFNPALVGRAFLQAAFPASLTTWMPAFAAGRFSILPSSILAPPLMAPVYRGPFFDGLSGATPLAAMKFDHQTTAFEPLLTGMTAGSTGETSAVLIILGGVYLAARRMMSWRIPVAVFTAVAIASALLRSIDPQYPGPIFMLFSGGLALGAVFMATDMVASPLTHGGCWVYGAVIGLLVVMIRLWSGMPEGVMYAILIANAISPHIDPLLRPAVYGTAQPKQVRE